MTNGHFLVAAPHKSSGKTTLTLGICGALAARGRRVQPFKKGPDFIDPMWLGAASGRLCYNLDLHLMQTDEIRRLFVAHTTDADMAVIEGNMGLFDSLDVEGTQSNAALAALLGSPVILVVDVRGMTRSVVPLLLGFQHFDPSIRIAGVILNKVAGARHETRLREAVAHYTDLPVLGMVHRDPRLGIDERHLGLIPSNEEAKVRSILQDITAAVTDYIDLDALERLATTAAPIPRAQPLPAVVSAGMPVRIGIARDRAFGFYYPDDLEALQAAGATLVPFDTLHDSHLPAVDGVFIGGGFPETQMDALAANTAMRQSIRAAIEHGLPVYAECGGLMYLTRSIAWQGRRMDMVGVIPADTVMTDKPVGRGYTRLKPTGAAPWAPCPAGVAFDAHEFHYSHLENLSAGLTFAYEVERGAGIDGRHDGIVYKNLLANYAHLRHLDGSPWAGAFVDFVRRVRGLSNTA
ncbi:MAG: cobyrinate a,c-diamide synthase [Gammaproteobacteria bacterium]|nr:cobyrinate a,c-diamide synthase [Gammaproteobacteria bacterium]